MPSPLLTFKRSCPPDRSNEGAPMLRLCTNLKSKLTVPMVCGTASYDAHQPHLARTKSAQRPRFCPLLIPRLRAPAPSRPHRHTAVPLGSRRRQRLDALRPWPRCWHCWRHHRALRRPPKRPPTGTLICRPRTATMPVAAESGDLCSLIPPPPPPLYRRSLALAAHDSPAASRVPCACAAAPTPPQQCVHEGQLWAPAGRRAAVTAANERCTRVSAAANGAAVHGSVGGVHGGREAATVASVAVAGRFGARRDRVSGDCLGGVMRDWRDLDLGGPGVAAASSHCVVPAHRVREGGAGAN